MTGSNAIPEAWCVSAEQAGLTLARVLRSFLPDASWSQTKRLVAARRVAVNGRLCLDDARRMTASDTITVCERPLPAPPMDARVAVRHLDDAVVVIEKPSGMMSVRHVAELDWPAQKRKLQPSADEVVLRRISQIQRGSSDLSSLPAHQRRRHVRPVHRLDRDTSGLLVYARTVEAEQNLVRQFSAHSITRQYVAVVHGAPIEQTIRNRLVRDRGDGLRGSTLAPDDGKPAATHIRPLESLGDYTAVECQLETGRTHQIRIHLAEQGQPVCGDHVYRGPINGPMLENSSNAPRLALHARVLEFEHPQTGERARFDAELPDDLASFIDRLRTDQ